MSVRKRIIGFPHQTVFQYLKRGLELTSSLHPKVEKEGKFDIPLIRCNLFP